jgi:GPH family glycoside/pentoside/hexuronide:cation symporter
MQEDTKKKQKLSLKEKFAYGLGDVGNNFLFDMGQIYLLKFYTDSLGLPATTAGLVFLVTKIWDGFADISVGTWIDNRKVGRRGKFRPFMLYAAFPLALLTVVSFTTPDFSLTGKTIWAFATYMVFGTVYSIFNIPYGSMIPAMTRNAVERSDLASFRWAGANTGLFLTTVGFIPIVMAFDSMQTGYVVAASVFAFAGLLLQYTCYSYVKERHVNTEKQQQARQSMSSSFKALFRNAPLLVLCLVNLFTFSAFNVKLAVQVYFCQYSLNDISITSLMGFFSIGCVFIGVAIVPFCVRRMGKKATYILGGCIWAVADLAAWFFAKDTVSFISFACLAFFGTSFINTLNWALISDAVEYGEWKTGNRSEGLVYSFFTFFRKLSQALAGFIPGVVLAMVGYIPNVVQTEKALNGIKGLMFIYPGVLAVATVIVMSLCYKLSDSRYNEIVTELNERKNIHL